MQNAFPSASKKLWPRPSENSNGQDGCWLLCFSNLFHSGNTKSMPDEVFDPELTKPDLNGVMCWVCWAVTEKKIKIWDLIPWSGSLHWSHFGRLSCCRALEVWKVFTAEWTHITSTGDSKWFHWIGLPEVRLTKECSSLLCKQFPFNRCQAEPVTWVAPRVVESKSLKVGKSLKIGKNRIKSEKSDLISY